MRDHILGSEKLAPFLSTHCPYVFYFPKFSKIFVVPRATIFGPSYSFKLFECFKMVKRDHILGGEQVAPLLSPSSRHPGLNSISDFLFACF